MSNTTDANEQLASSDLLSVEELRVVSLLAHAWNAFVALETLHPDEQNEFRAVIHLGQKLIMARPVQREFNSNNDQVETRPSDSDEPQNS